MPNLPVPRRTSPPDYPGIWPSARHAGASGVRSRAISVCRISQAMADPSHERHAEMLEWCGPDFDPNAVDEPPSKAAKSAYSAPKIQNHCKPLISLSADAYGGPISRISSINPIQLHLRRCGRSHLGHGLPARHRLRASAVVRSADFAGKFGGDADAPKPPFGEMPLTHEPEALMLPVTRLSGSLAADRQDTVPH